MEGNQIWIRVIARVGVLVPMASFNRAITDGIVVEEAFFGRNFVGYVPQDFILGGKGAIEQFVVLARTWDYNRMDFECEVSANRKAVYINSWFWAQHDFSGDSIDPQQKRKVMGWLQQAWEFNRVKIPLPPAFRGRA